MIWSFERWFVRFALLDAEPLATFPFSCGLRGPQWRWAPFRRAMHPVLLALLAAGGVGQGLAAQDTAAAAVAVGPSAAALAAAAQTITAAELSRHLTALAALAAARAPDSSQTPTAERAAEQAAVYIAQQWQPLGLVPTLPPGWGAIYPDSAAPRPWVQRATAPGQRRLRTAKLFLRTTGTRGYPIRDEAGSDLEQDLSASVSFGTDAHFVPEAGRPIVREMATLSLGQDLSDYAPGSRRTLLVAGPHTAATLRALGPQTFADAVVFYVPPAALDSAGRRAVLAALYGMSQGVIVLSDADSAAFAREQEAAQHASVTIVDHYLLETIARRREWPWVAAVRPTAVPSHFWVAAGIEPAALRTQAAPLVRELVGTGAWLAVSLEQDASTPVANSSRAAGSSAASSGGSGADGAAAAAPTYPYVLGFLEGTDSLLKWQQVIITASLGAPSTQAAELAGLVLLARTFSQPEVRPRRSVLFVAAGSGPPEHAGSWLVADQVTHRSQAAVAALTLERLEADTNASAGDARVGAARPGVPQADAPHAGATLVVDGGPDVVWPQALTWVTATHPELGLQLVDTGTVFRPGTAALAFAAHLVPGLRLSVDEAGTTAASAAVTATEARVRALRFAWYLAATLANAPGVPRWTTAGRRQALHFQP